MLQSMVRAALACGAIAALVPSTATASFHFAHISEVMTSYGGDANVQFVEITMEAAGQHFVFGTKLNAFDANGNFIATVLTVPSDVASGVNRPWIMGTTAFEAASGIQADFEFAPGVIPTGSGMVCWGKPGNNTGTPSCPLSGVPYVDCVAYGNYVGPANNCIGTPHPISPDGHSLRRTAHTGSNANDFICSDPAQPTNNANVSASMPATTPCPVCGNDTAEPPNEECDGTDDGACLEVCLSNCVCAVCGDNDVNQSSEECDGIDDTSCPGDCLNDCTCAVCGDNVAEAPAEDCDGTDDVNCPGLCIAPSEPGECRCPGSLDHFLCYKASYKREIIATLTDSFDTGVYTAKKGVRVCTPTDKENEGVSDDVTHLTAYKIKGAHVAQTNVDVTNQLGTFQLDTKKADKLMVPALKTIFPDPPPAGPPSGELLDNYRCLKAKYAKTSLQVAKGTTVSVEDQFSTNVVEIKKPTALCIATNRDGDAPNRPNDHLMCFKVKPAVKHMPGGVQVRDYSGLAVVGLKGEFELCVPSTLP